MLLQALYEYAENNDLLDKEAFKNQSVRWLIPLDPEGNLRGGGVIDLADSDHKKGQSFKCPGGLRPKGAGGVAEFMADGLTAVFGLDSDPSKTEKLSEKKRDTRNGNNRAKCEDFWRQVEEACRNTDSRLASVMLEWKKLISTDNGRLNPKFVRFGTSDPPKENEKSKWWITTAAGQEVAMGPGERFTFEIDGHIVLSDPILMNYWQDVFMAEKEKIDEDAGHGICLITGRSDTSIQRSHPVVKVPGGLTTGSYLISFSAAKKGDTCSFTSYGKVKGDNAPISTKAASAYSASLSKFLADKNHHYLLGPITICFWAKKRDEFSNQIVELLEAPYEENVAGFFNKWFGGTSPPEMEDDRFYAVTLSGNAGRVVVKNWIDQPLFQAAENMKKWFDDLELDHISQRSEKKKGKKEGKPPLSIFRLACSTVREPKELQSGVSNQLFRAALEGISPSSMLLKPILHRFKCDLVNGGYVLNPSRFALIKLILIGNRKENDFMPEKILCETNDIPYNLGRLLAVLEKVQQKYHDYKLKVGVVERYYGAASTSPASVFPLLLGLAQHHKRKIKAESSGNAGWVDKEIREISAKIQPEREGEPPDFPRILTLQQQGRFALGFYQQKAHDFAVWEAKKNDKTE